MIRNYALFWRREDVFWGRQKVPGSLLGKRRRNPIGTPVDFKDQQGVYVLYDEAISLVYVGQTGAAQNRLLGRLRQHTSDHLSRRWSKFSWFGIPNVNNDGSLRAERAGAVESVGTVLDQIEAVLIAAGEPLLNRQGGKFGQAEEYVQVRDERLGPTTDQMIRKLYENLQSAN